MLPHCTTADRTCKSRNLRRRPTRSAHRMFAIDKILSRHRKIQLYSYPRIQDVFNRRQCGVVEGGRHEPNSSPTSPEGSDGADDRISSTSSKRTSELSNPTHSRDRAISRGRHRRYGHAGPCSNNGEETRSEACHRVETGRLRLYRDVGSRTRGARRLYNPHREYE